MSDPPFQYYVVNWATKAVRELPPNTAPDFNGDWEKLYFPRNEVAHVVAYYCWEPPIVIDGVHIWYHWELANMHGAWFLLFVPRSKKYLKGSAIAFLKSKFDVVESKVLYVKDDGVQNRL